MCEYCEEKKDLVRSHKNGLHILMITKHENDGNFTIDMGTPFGIWCEPIDYCPKCGEKLGG